MTIEERNKMVVDNLRLIHHILRGYPNISKDKLLYEDLFQDCCYDLLKKMHLFDPERGKLNTFIGQVCRTTVKMYFRKNSKCPKTVSENYTVCGDEHGDDITTLDKTLLYEDNTSDTISNYDYENFMNELKKHNVKHLDIFIEYAVYDKPQAEIARERGVSRQAISACIFKTRKQLREIYNNVK